MKASWLALLLVTARRPYCHCCGRLCHLVTSGIWCAFATHRCGVVQLDLGVLHENVVGSSVSHLSFQGKAVMVPVCM